MAESSQRLPPAQKDHFLERMLYFQSSQVGRDQPTRPHEQPFSGAYVPLHSFVARPGVGYSLPRPRAAAQVQIDSPATEVMTDLRLVMPVTVSPQASVDAANQVMIDKRVRALFVVDDATRYIIGVITATDILGERPLQVAQQQQIHRGDLVARDIMTGADKLEVLDLHDVARSRVGDLVATLKLAGRQHALVVETVDGSTRQQTVCGIFSLTQIARQLGIPAQQVHDIARTFAEIEAVIGT